jgi:hypothetical protein
MFTNDTSTPNEISRYRFVLILIIVIIVAGFALLMRWQTTAIAKIQANVELTTEEKMIEIRRLDNVWSLAHFGFYVGLGILMPNNWTLILTLQITWELFEDFPGYRLGKKQYIETDGKKMFDIVCNSTGYLLGNTISKRFNVIRRR